MSWNIGFRGPKAEAKKQLELQAQSPLAAYAGKPEADDIKAALDRMHALIDALVIGDNGYGQVTDGVSANAYGSHSVSSVGLLSGSFSVSVSAVKLED